MTDGNGSTDWAWPVLVALVTASWVAAALADGDPAPIDTTAAGAAAAAGTAAVAGSCWARVSSQPLWLAVTTLIVLPVAVAAGTRGSAPVMVIGLLVLAVAEVIASLAPDPSEPSSSGPTSREEVWLQAGLVLVATSVLIAAIAAGHDRNGEWAFTAQSDVAGWFGLGGAAVLVAAAALGPARGRAFAVPGLLVGLVVGPGLSAVAVAVAGGTLAVLSAALLGRRPGVALGFLGLGATAFSGGRPGAALLLAGAALALSYAADHPATGLLGLPGAAALGGDVLTAGGGGAPVVLAVAMAATAVLLALAATRPGPRLHLGAQAWAALPAAVLAAWLVLAPGTWTWTGAAGLGIYDRGAAAAAAGGAVVVLIRWAAALGGAGAPVGR